MVADRLAHFLLSSLALESWELNWFLFAIIAGKQCILHHTSALLRLFESKQSNLVLVGSFNPSSGVIDELKL